MYCDLSAISGRNLIPIKSFLVHCSILMLSARRIELDMKNEMDQPTQ
jgi:hypothetical protein